IAPPSVMSGRGTTQPDWKNCTEDRRFGNVVRAPPNATGPTALSRNITPGNPRTAFYRRVASQRHQRVASSARGGSGASMSYDVGSKVAISTYPRRRETPNSARDAKL